jgi:hypothetical protein
MRVEALDGIEALEAADSVQASNEHGGHAPGRDLGDQLESVEPLSHHLGRAKG